MTLFFDLLPMMVGSALAPLWIIAVLLILQSHNGLVKAIAFVSGVTLVRLLQGVVFGALLGQVAAGDGAGESRLVVSVLLMVLGLLLLMSAVKTLMNTPDPDAPAPQWMKTLDRSSAPRLLGLGMVFTLVAPKLWVFTLSALGIIQGSALTTNLGQFKAFLGYIVGAQSLLVLPMLACAIAPRQSRRLLRSVSDWLNAHHRQITLVVSLVFGTLFLWKGCSGLVGNPGVTAGVLVDYAQLHPNWA